MNHLQSLIKVGIGDYYQSSLRGIFEYLQTIDFEFVAVLSLLLGKLCSLRKLLFSAHAKSLGVLLFFLAFLILET